MSNFLNNFPIISVQWPVTGKTQPTTCTPDESDAFAQLMSLDAPQAKQQNHTRYQNNEISTEEPTSKNTQAHTLKGLSQVLQGQLQEPLQWQFKSSDSQQSKGEQQDNVAQASSESTHYTLHLKISNTRLQGCELILKGTRFTDGTGSLHIECITATPQQTNWLLTAQSNLVSQLSVLLPNTHITFSLKGAS